MIELVINADDFGMTDGVCRAVLELLNRGAISSTTVMAAAAGAPERCRRWGLQNLKGVAGVHLQLTSGSPTVKASKLADAATGQFLADFDCFSPELVFEEWRQQIELVADLIGGRPSHLDSHNGVHHLPQFVDAYISLAVEYGLPVRGGSELVVQRMSANGIHGTSEVLFDWTGQGFGAAELRRQLIEAAQLLDNKGSLEVVTHPAYSDAELQAISSLSTLRDSDRVALQDLGESGWLSAHSFVLTSYSELRHAVDPTSPEEQHGVD